MPLALITIPTWVTLLPHLSRTNPSRLSVSKGRKNVMLRVPRLVLLQLIIITLGVVRVPLRVTVRDSSKGQ